MTMIIVFPHGIDIGLPNGLSHSWSHTHLHMRWMHGNAAASAKRTEIRRAALSLREAALGVSKQHPSLRKLKQLCCFKDDSL